MTATIAIVEDDPDQARNYAEALRRHGYAAAIHADRQTALAAFADALPDLAILDIMLGEDREAGFEICRHLSVHAPQLPVIFLTSRSDDIDRISGLRLGAWDYQTKPVSLAFLIERIHSLFRIRENRSQPAGTSLIETGDLRLDPAALRVQWQGRDLDLTYTEFNLLAAIVEHSEGRGASYEALAEATRQGIVENNTINTHIRHIRAKFRQRDGDFDCIRNVYGFGYRWGCP